MKALPIAAIAVAALIAATPAFAKTKRAQLANGLHPDCNITMPCTSVGSAQSRMPAGRYSAVPDMSPIGIARNYAGKTRDFFQAGGYISGRLVCAKNVNAELARRGIRGTNSNSAKSFLTWGAPSGPTPGAVAVFNRGRNPRNGHVAIVSRVEGGEVYILNPQRGGWREIPLYKQPIAYRVASAF